MSAQYDRAMADIRKGLTASQGGTSSEAAAAEAYQAMVREGTAKQIKMKYRVGRRRKQVR